MSIKKVGKYEYQKSRIYKDTPKEVLDKVKIMFSYNKETGEITNLRYGEIYTNKNKKGYIRDIYLMYNGTQYAINGHRLAWFLATGEALHKEEQVDHINHIKHDNRFINLRKCSNAENQRNTLNRGKSSQYKGVSSYTDRRSGLIRYSVSISINGKRKSVGKFQDEITAAKYYDAAARFYYGEFSFVNFNETFIPTLDVEELRKYKKENIIIKSAKGIAIVQLDNNDNYVRDWDSSNQAAKFLGVTASAILACIWGNNKTCK
jgi:hypothetical protein